MTNDRSHTDPRLVERVRRLDAMLSTVDECFKVVDQGCLLIDMNPRGLEMIEADSLDEVVGADVRSLLLPEYQQDFVNGLQRALRGERVTQEFQIQGLRGTRRWMQQVAVAIPSDTPDTPPTTIAAFTRDITHVRKTVETMRAARDAAEASNRAKSEFLANMSHEIRTPMTAILGHIELLQIAFAGDDSIDAGASLRTVQQCAGHLLEIIDDILHLSKHEAGMLELHPEPVDPLSLTGQVARLFEASCTDKGLELQLKTIGRIPELVTIDPVRLRQALLNLVGNAVKFTSKGSIRIELERPDGSEDLVLRVSDTGLGMTDEQLVRIRRFEPFVQADSSASRRFGGTGLGLRLSHKFAQLLGGNLEVESKIDHGTTFTLTVHAPENNDRHAIADLREEPDAPPGRCTLEGVRVLLVEDYESNQKLFRFHLERAGAEVVVASDGREAMDFVTNGAGTTADIILLDMQLPVMDGYETSAAMRGLGIETPIIALTAHAMQGDEERCIAAGCDDFQAKPVSGPELIARCAKWVSAARKRDAA